MKHLTEQFSFRKWMKQAVSILVMLNIVQSVAQTTSIEVSGDVSGTWTADTIHVMGNLFIPEGEVLTISPGSLVQFQGHYRIQVRGTLNAEGSEQDTIFFSIADTTGFADTLSTAGGWNGIFYEHLPHDLDTSLFRFCHFSYGKAFGQDSTELNGGVFRVLDFDRITLEHCCFRNNYADRWGGAVYARNADLVIRHCSFINNRCGGAIEPWGYGGALCFIHSEPHITNNHFSCNRSTGIGGAASFEYSDPVFQFNVILDNFSGLGGGIGFLRSSPQHIVSNNLIAGNEALFFGGGIACIGAHTVFSNNTIVQNTATYGGGLYCNDSAVPSSYNTIFYDNFAYEGVEVYIWDIRSAPNFYYCNVPGNSSGFAGSGGHEGYHGEYYHNTDTIPGFTGSGDSPFALSPNSTFIDAGTPDTSGLQIPFNDLAGNLRYYNSRIDPGAYEWNPGYWTELSKIQTSLKSYPNPFYSEICLAFSLEQPDKITIGIYDLDGIRIYSFPEENFTSGDHELFWDGRNDSGMKVIPGLYICKFSGISITGYRLIIYEK